MKYHFEKLLRNSLCFIICLLLHHGEFINLDQLVNEFCQFKKWETLKDEHHLDNDMYFQWAQLIHAIPQIRKDKLKQNLSKNENNPLVLNHHLIKNARILTLDKFTAKEIYSILISSVKNKPTSQN